MVPAYKRFRNPSLGQESEGRASERIFLAGENERVLTRVARITQQFNEAERYDEITSPAAFQRRWFFAASMKASMFSRGVSPSTAWEGEKM